MSAKKRRKVFGVRRETRRPRGWTRWFHEGLFESETAGSVLAVYRASGDRSHRRVTVGSLRLLPRKTIGVYQFVPAPVCEAPGAHLRRLPPSPRRGEGT